MVGFTADISGTKRLAEKIDAVKKWLSDLSPLFEQYGADFYKDERRIFSLKGPGQYQDLSDKYANQKLNKYGFEYPILFATGTLARSLLKRNAGGSIFIVRPMEFYIGTSIPYAVYHHSDQPRTIIPLRPVYFFSRGNKPMQERWIRLTQVYIDKGMDGLFS